MSELTHIDNQGRVRMVDVSEKKTIPANRRGSGHGPYVSQDV